MPHIFTVSITMFKITIYVPEESVSIAYIAQLAFQSAKNSFGE